MRSPTKPWYRASKDAWYVQFNGRKVRLAKDHLPDGAADKLIRDVTKSYQTLKFTDYGFEAD